MVENNTLLNNIRGFDEQLELSNIKKLKNTKHSE